MICSKCNHNLPDDSEFCQYCGSKIQKVTNITDNTPAVSPATHSANMSADTETVSVRSETASEGVSNEPIEVMAPINQTSTSSQAPHQTSAKEPTKRLALNKHTIVYIGLSLLIVLAVGFGILQTVSVQKLQTEVTDLEKQITTKEATMLHLEKQIVHLNADIRSLNRDIASYEKLASFIDDYVVFIEDDGTNLYHKFNCYKFRGDSFWYTIPKMLYSRASRPAPFAMDKEAGPRPMDGGLLPYYIFSIIFACSDAA